MQMEPPTSAKNFGSDIQQHIRLTRLYEGPVKLDDVRPRAATLSAMNQPLATALSEYYQTNSPKLQNGSLDFCNSFWGFDDAGVDVLFARMRGAAQTIEGLNVFWKERQISDFIYSNLSVSKHACGQSVYRGGLRKTVG